MKSLNSETCTRRECRMNMEAEVGEMHRQAEECQRWPANHPKLGERLGTDSLTASSRNQRCWHLNSGLLASRTMRKYISVILGHPACGFIRLATGLWVPGCTLQPALELAGCPTCVQTRSPNGRQNQSNTTLG